MYYDTFDTPDGQFTAIVSDNAVLAAGWTDDLADLLSRVPAVKNATQLTRAPEKVVFAKSAVNAYYAGDLAAVSKVGIRQDASPFKTQVLQQIRKIAPGQTVTYSELAQRAGNPKAVRAAASACATNSVALFVPCHRVVAKDGSLAGFLYGVAIKKRLLAHEQAQEKCQSNEIETADI